MFLLRLLKGVFKGLLVGALVGYALAAAGFVSLGPIAAYAAAMVAGLFMALIAGKAIWEKGARIEVGMKALAGGLLLGPGLMWLVRRFVTFGLPFDTALLPGVATASATAGTFAVTALALVAAVIGGFFDLDNADAPEAETAATKKRIQAPSARIADSATDEQPAEAESNTGERMHR